MGLGLRQHTVHINTTLVQKQKSNIMFSKSNRENVVEKE